MRFDSLTGAFVSFSGLQLLARFDTTSDMDTSLLMQIVHRG